MGESQNNKPNRLPWLIVGGLGCLVICLGVVILAGGSLFFFASPFQNIATNPSAPTAALPLPPASGATGIAPAGGRTPTLSAPLSTLPAALPTATATTASAAPTGKIAFSVGRGDRPEDKAIFVMNVDGTGVAKILDRASEPTFSPDGKKIAYYRWTDGVFVANVDGSDAKKVLGETCTGFIDWSRDGKTIAATIMPGCKGNDFIDLVAPDGTGRRNLTIGASPAWSPDDSELIFHTCRETRCGIYKVKASGGDVAAITTDDGGLPTWSPDGKQILYQKDVDGVKQMFEMNADGSNKKQLTQGPAINVDGVYSPDSRFIYYRSTEGSVWGIWRMNRDGSAKVKLINDVPPVNWAYEKLAITK